MVYKFANPLKAVVKEIVVTANYHRILEVANMSIWMGGADGCYLSGC